MLVHLSLLGGMLSRWDDFEAKMIVKLIHMVSVFPRFENKTHRQVYTEILKKEGYDDIS